MKGDIYTHIHTYIWNTLIRGYRTCHMLKLVIMFVEGEQTQISLRTRHNSEIAERLDEDRRKDWLPVNGSCETGFK